MVRRIVRLSVVCNVLYCGHGKTTVVYVKFVYDVACTNLLEAISVLRSYSKNESSMLFETRCSTTTTTTTTTTATSTSCSSSCSAVAGLGRLSSQRSSTRRAHNEQTTTPPNEQPEPSPSSSSGCESLVNTALLLLLLILLLLLLLLTMTHTPGHTSKRSLFCKRDDLLWRCA